MHSEWVFGVNKPEIIWVDGLYNYKFTWFTYFGAI